MKCAVCFFLLLKLSVFVINGESAQILGLFTTWSRSHLIIKMATINTLVERGHNVTVVTTLPLNDENPKYHHIKLATHKVRKNFFNNMIDGKEKGFLEGLKIVKNLVEYGFELSNSSLNDPNMKKLLREGTFDAVVMGYFLNDFEMGVAAHFKCPLILIDTHKSMQVTNGFIGNPLEIFYVPSALLSRTQPLTFFGRLVNLLVSCIEALKFKWYAVRMNTFYEYNFPSDKYPPHAEVKKNVSLILHTSHFSEGLIRPNVPAFIEIGGIQVKSKPEPLPEDIKKMLDGADEHGAIYFSLGSNAQSAELKPETMSIVYNVLSGLKQRVIWKWEDDNVPGNSSNILFKKWLPQDDILAHRNIKLFISHVGLGSMVESQYHGVPIVGMPLFADQFKIMNEAVEAGFGVIVNYHHLTEESLKSAVLEVLHNSKYRNAVQKFSNLYRDRPMSPQDTAAFWMEYVIRHKGAKHMQSPAVYMNSIQYFGLDVIGFVLAVIYIGYKVIVLLLKILFCKFFKRKSAANKRKNE